MFDRNGISVSASFDVCSGDIKTELEGQKSHIPDGSLEDRWDQQRQRYLASRESSARDGPLRYKLKVPLTLA